MKINLFAILSSKLKRRVKELAIELIMKDPSYKKEDLPKILWEIKGSKDDWHIPQPSMICFFEEALGFLINEMIISENIEILKRLLDHETKRRKHEESFLSKSKRESPLAESSRKAIRRIDQRVDFLHYTLEEYHLRQKYRIVIEEELRRSCLYDKNIAKILDGYI